jgi:hypothetical protein
MVCTSTDLVHNIMWYLNVIVTIGMSLMVTQLLIFRYTYEKAKILAKL